MNMAIDLFVGVGKVIVQPFYQPPCTMQEVGLNVIKLTGRYTFSAGSAAALLAIFAKYLKKEGSLPTQLLTASVMSSVVSFAVLALIVYRFKSSGRYSECDLEVQRFEKIVTVIAGAGSVAAGLFTFVFFKGNNNIAMSIARHSYLPLAWCAVTTGVILIYHQSINVSP
jgi:hypothetical protein